VICEKLAKSKTEIREMSVHRLQLMEEKYEQQKIAEMMKELYNWIITGKNRPEFVFTI
jgi:hypothetical protein